MPTGLQPPRLSSTLPLSLPDRSALRDGMAKFQGHAGRLRPMTPAGTGILLGCGGQQELVSVGLGMVSQLVRAAAARVRRASRERWRRRDGRPRSPRPPPPGSSMPSRS